MNEPWYSKLGFSSNPFSAKPAALTNEIIGQNTGPILEKIDNGEMQFIEAPLGSGKTSMLKSIIARFGGKRKLIYASCILNESLDVQNILKNASLRGRIFGSLSREMMLMIDEAQNISKADAQEISKFIENGNVKSVTFFGISYDKKLFTDELNKSLNGNVIVLSYLTNEQAIELARNRVGNLKLLPDYVIREIYGRSNGNPRRFLQYCEDICHKAVNLSINELTITDVGTLLKEYETLRNAKKVAVKKPKLKRKKKSVKREKSKKNVTATVTYSGYDLENIRSYDEEMGKTEQ